LVDGSNDDISLLKNKLLKLLKFNKKIKINVMKNIRLILLVFFILLKCNIYAQNIEECGFDENFELTRIESEYLNNYFKEERKNFNFINKKIVIVTGGNGQQIGNKKIYFENIKKWADNGNKISSSLILFNEEEKLKSGCDGILTLRVKIFTPKGKRKIIKRLSINKDKLSINIK
jgi:hypothetical protein